MELIEEILSQNNLKEAIRRVKINKGAPGIDKRTIDELDSYFKEHQTEIKDSILKMKYHPQDVRRVYIPKANGKKRPLGIPTVVDRVIQQAIAQVLMKIYDPHFSNCIYGFRSKRSAHDAIEQVLEYLDSDYQWAIDLDIEKYFDTVNHDKLISTLDKR
ncbi:recombinase [Lactobacillus reuteri]|nr:recombinase [Limosilactobacillus reuteri]